ncbi:hypothetical protein A1O1_02232 [Capronia coronata CBS 617.96]|uniref:LysM domain-containing protein n=1 Tax=Capronia coronata CBS 617.96 TaxID=1182541 RepID=W9ZHA0_9EURO|nr:uncharacterized protein A1O1_02232 [Capronia coronata CBS 617.96]EXJ93839.1 hypothetical protein A1O1_02232 [Capronia coronata CBS 617.96]
MGSLLKLASFLTIFVLALGTSVAVCGAAYTVRDGDTACEIAVHCGVELRNLLEANPNISSWNSLQKAQVIQLPSTASCGSCSTCAQANPTDSVKTAPVTATAPAATATTMTGKAYTVVAGDTAWNIAARFGVSLEALEAANPDKVANWDLLQIGFTLNIPSPTVATPPSMATTTTSGIVPAPTLQYPPSTYSTPTLPQPTPTSASVWTVSSGDTGNGIASGVSVPFSDISTANPTVVWTQLTPGQTIIIPPAPTGLSQVTGAAAVHDVDTTEGVLTPKDTYTFYSGDGSSAAGWPQVSDWLAFDAMFDHLKPYMGQNCISNVPGNSPDETEQVRDAVLSVANQTYMDPRFMLAVVMQESNGCVRVVTTVGGNSNPGLMQSFKGKGSCNLGGQVLSPCPGNVIHQMIVDGTAAPVDGITLVKALNQATSLGVADLAQAFYRAARLYNSGASSLPTNGDLGGAPGATLCYSSDIANRLMGWFDGPTACHLDARA